MAGYAEDFVFNVCVYHLGMYIICMKVNSEKIEVIYMKATYGKMYYLDFSEYHSLSQ